MKRSIVVIAVVLVGVAAVAGVKFGPEQLRIWEAKSATAKLLRDPDSAKFTDIVVRDTAVCGMVNSKNGYGAMAGSVAFIYRKAGGAELEPVGLSTTEDYRQSMKGLCDSELELEVQSGDGTQIGKTPACLSYRKAIDDQKRYLTWIVEGQKVCALPK